MDSQESGRIGGLSTSRKYGSAHFVQAGKAGGLETLRRHGASHYSDMGKAGGRPLAQPPTEYKGYPLARGRDIGRPQDTNLFILLPCEECGKERWVRFIKGKPETRLCRHCSGVKSSWKGGRVVCASGYIQIKLNPGDFYYPMTKAQGYVFEHRLVMAQSLGRCLQPWETVHHKDGNKSNNELSNLELTTKNNHASDHNKGYSDGFTRGFQDGRSRKIRELEAEIAKLKAMTIISNP